MDAPFDPAAHTMIPARTFGEFAVGETFNLPSRTMTEAMFTMFQALSGDNHPIHYDREYAAVEGHPDVLVHGPLQGAWLSQFVTDWIGPKGRLLNLTWQNRARAFPERDLTFKGRVTAAAGGVERARSPIATMSGSTATSVGSSIMDERATWIVSCANTRGRSAGSFTKKQRPWPSLATSSRNAASESVALPSPITDTVTPARTRSGTKVV